MLGWIRKQKYDYNAPVTLTLTFIALAVTIADYLVPGGLVNDLLAAPTHFNVLNPFFYTSLVTHIFAHAGLDHWFGNFLLLVILGNMMEKRFGSFKLALIIILTAIVTALINALIFSQGLVGASGIVFLFIVLASFMNRKAGTIPITFVLVLIMWISKEVFNSIRADGVSQYAHLMGGFCGSMFGWLMTGQKKES
jgi:membrane associated rhomboid family serine protease